MYYSYRRDFPDWILYFFIRKHIVDALVEDMKLFIKCF